MKKTYLFLILSFVSEILFSQTGFLEAINKVQKINLPFTDKTDVFFKNTIEVNEADWRLYEFQKLEMYDSDFEYYIYGSVIVNNQKLLLIGRKYREEINHWVVLLGNKDKVVSFLNIAYSNSDKILAIESLLNNEFILVKENNGYNNNSYSETKYTVDETGFIKK